MCRVLAVSLTALALWGEATISQSRSVAELQRDHQGVVGLY
jgi:hypothetical protein